jgi:hypothetical protein
MTNTTEKVKRLEIVAMDPPKGCPHCGGVQWELRCSECGTKSYRWGSKVTAVIGTDDYVCAGCAFDIDLEVAKAAYPEAYAARLDTLAGFLAAYRQRAVDAGDAALIELADHACATRDFKELKAALELYGRHHRVIDVQRKGNDAQNDRNEHKQGGPKSLRSSGLCDPAARWRPR